MGGCVSKEEQIGLRKDRKIVVEESTMKKGSVLNGFYGESYSAERLICGICLQEYDLGVRCPMMICTGQHTICKRCLKGITSKEMEQCPFCKTQLLRYIAKNRLLVQLLEERIHKEKLHEEQPSLPVSDNLQVVALKNEGPMNSTLTFAREYGYEETSKLLSSQATQATIIDEKSSHITGLIDLSVFQNLKYLMLSGDGKDHICNANFQSQITFTLTKFCIQLSSNLNTGLGTLPKLTQLYIRYRHLHGIPKLGHLPMLNSLGLGRNSIPRIQNLQSFKTLQYLYLAGNNITRINNLEALVNLQFLQLSSNYIQKLENMEKISKLIKLWLHNNKISRIENLSSLRLLEELDLDDNQIVVVQNLNNLPQLFQVQLKNNPIDLFRSQAELQLLRNKGVDLCQKYGWFN